MKIKPFFLFSVLFLYGLSSTFAQDAGVIPTCNESSKSTKMIGGRYLLSLPKGAIVKTGMDIDYSAFSIGYGKRKNRFWLSGIFGGLVLGQRVPEDLVSSSVNVTQRTWNRGGVKVMDTKGQLGNGNYWRYFGEGDDLIRYENVSAEAAIYFDSILVTVCFRNR
jgi:hypothetical protein